MAAPPGEASSADEDGAAAGVGAGAPPARGPARVVGHRDRIVNAHHETAVVDGNRLGVGRLGSGGRFRCRGRRLVPDGRGLRGLLEPRLARDVRDHLVVHAGTVEPDQVLRRHVGIEPGAAGAEKGEDGRVGHLRARHLDDVVQEGIRETLLPGSGDGGEGDEGEDREEGSHASHATHENTGFGDFIPNGSEAPALWYTRDPGRTQMNAMKRGNSPRTSAGGRAEPR